MADDPYFGYTPSSNTALQGVYQLPPDRADELTHYTDAATSGLPPYQPTVNWNDSRYSDGSGKDIKGDYVRQAGSATIEMIRLRIASQSADKVDALQEQ